MSPDDGRDNRHMDIPQITPAAAPAGVNSIAAAQAVAIEQAQNLSFLGVAPTTVELSMLGRFLSLAALFQKKTLDLQASLDAGADTRDELADVTASAAALAGVINELQASTVDDTGTLASQFFQRFGEDAEAGLAAIGLRFGAPPAGGLGVDDAALQDAFERDPAATTALLGRAADAFFGVVTAQVQAQALNPGLPGADLAADDILPLPAALPQAVAGAPERLPVQPAGAAIVTPPAGPIREAETIATPIPAPAVAVQAAGTTLVTPPAAAISEPGSIAVAIPTPAVITPLPAAVPQEAAVVPAPGTASPVVQDPVQAQAAAPPPDAPLPGSIAAELFVQNLVADIVEPPGASETVQVQAITAPVRANIEPASNMSDLFAPATAAQVRQPDAIAVPVPVPVQAPPASLPTTAPGDTGDLAQEERVLVRQLQAEARALDEKIANASPTVRAALAEDPELRDAPRIGTATVLPRAVPPAPEADDSAQPPPPAVSQPLQAARDPAIAAALAAYNLNTAAFAALNAKPDIQPARAKTVAPVASVSKVVATDALGTPHDELPRRPA